MQCNSYLEKVGSKLMVWFDRALFKFMKKLILTILGIQGFSSTLVNQCLLNAQ